MLLAAPVIGLPPGPGRLNPAHPLVAGLGLALYPWASLPVDLVTGLRARDPAALTGRPNLELHRIGPAWAFQESASYIRSFEVWDHPAGPLSLRCTVAALVRHTATPAAGSILVGKWGASEDWQLGLN